MEILKKCLNPKLLVGLGVIAIGILLFAPRLFASALPLLILAACPLSMVLMMAMMTKDHGGKPQGKTSILQERYAKGDISEQEFDSMTAKLKGRDS